MKKITRPELILASLAPTKSSRTRAGGMCEVYKARDTRLDVSSPSSPAQPIAKREYSRQRFEREAFPWLAQPPHICVLHDLANQAGTAYM